MDENKNDFDVGLGAINNIVELYNLVDFVEEPPRRYRIQHKINPFDLYSDREFEGRYRLSKTLVFKLYELIDGVSRHNSDFRIPGILKLLTALRYYAVGCFLEILGDSFGISKSSICDIVSEVSFLIASKRSQFVRMPDDQDSLLATKALFHRISGFPLAICAIDGTHIRVQSFGGDNAGMYRSRFKYFSLNCHFAVTADMRIVDVVTRWPGSAHDATIFGNSNFCENLDRGVYGDDIAILGDSAYGAQIYMCKPLADCDTVADRRYQRAQIGTRNIVERLFGVLKRRFPCLGLGMRYRREKVHDVIVACCVLHNFMLLEEMAPMAEMNIDANEIEVQRTLGNRLVEARQNSRREIPTKDFLIDNYFIRRN